MVSLKPKTQQPSNCKSLRSQTSMSTPPAAQGPKHMQITPMASSATPRTAVVGNLTHNMGSFCLRFQSVHESFQIIPEACGLGASPSQGGSQVDRASNQAQHPLAGRAK